jgi:DNA-binding response OmpR family regulator
MEKKRNILIADDEKEIISLLRLFLEKENINVYEAYDGEMAYMIMEHYEIDLAILDIMMPRMNGFEVIKKLRQKYNIPVMILSAKVALDDKVYGLEVGADDYIPKPFEPLEVVARVKAHFRRNELKAENGNTNTFSDIATNTASDRLIRYNDMMLNLDSCQFSVGDNVMDLTKIEFNIMEMFMNSPGRVFTKEQIFERGWDDSFVDDNTIRVTISRLRDKIGNDRIKTIRGLGYRLESK